jgi:hypothetical protein
MACAAGGIKFPVVGLVFNICITAAIPALAEKKRYQSMAEPLILSTVFKKKLYLLAKKFFLFNKKGWLLTCIHFCHTGDAPNRLVKQSQ